MRIPLRRLPVKTKGHDLLSIEVSGDGRAFDFRAELLPARGIDLQYCFIAYHFIREIGYLPVARRF